MSAPDEETSKPAKRSGHVRHDSGGRAIWEWAMDSGRHAIDSTSRLLKKLDLTSLSLVDDDTKKKWEKDSQDSAAKAEPAPKALATPGLRVKDAHVGGGGSFDPYNSRTPTGRGVAPAKPRTPARPRITQPVKPSKRPGFFARLFGRR